MYPSDYRYTEEHEWLKQDGEEVIVGITEHAAEQLGDLVFVELPEEGTTVVKGDEVVTIESVKAASDITAPLDGQITDVNAAIVENPSLTLWRPRHGGHVGFVGGAPWRPIYAAETAALAFLRAHL